MAFFLPPFPASPANPGGVAQNPVEWLRAHDIRLTLKEGLDDEAVRDALAGQLGPPWHGVAQAAAPHVAAVCVLSGLASLGKWSERSRLLHEFSSAYDVQGNRHPRIRVEYILSPWLQDEVLTRHIDAVARKHAYANTAAMAVFSLGGKLNEIGWLKTVDRTLWYALQNIGRRSFLVEGGGSMAHYVAECVAGKPLETPYVDHAVSGIEDFLHVNGIADLAAATSF